ncbi:hypothetical protein IAI18_11050 [Acetobacteraceae bacterium H6797]|nr:hypothetical protein [Acetobacteraceae bacterium H6797]
MLENSPASPPAPPSWMVPSLWRGMIAARDAAIAHGATEAAALLAARRDAEAHAFALPPAQLEEAMAILAGTRPTALHLEATSLSPAPRETVVAALSRALRLTPRRRPRLLRSRERATRDSAEWIADQLARSNLVIVSLSEDRQRLSA